jgi:hypothetical protein
MGATVLRKKAAAAIRKIWAVNAARQYVTESRLSHQKTKKQKNQRPDFHRLGSPRIPVNTVHRPNLNIKGKVADPADLNASLYSVEHIKHNRILFVTPYWYATALAGWPGQETQKALDAHAAQAYTLMEKRPV